MLNPFIELLAQIIHLYMICIVAWAVLATLISFRIVNGGQPLIQRLMYALNRLCEPSMRPIRKFMPDLGGIDLAPIIVLLLLNFAHSALIQYFYNL